MIVSTSDVGLLLKALLEHNVIPHHESGNGEEIIDVIEVTEVDATDPNNPVLYLENGQIIQVRLYRTEY